MPMMDTVCELRGEDKSGINVQRWIFAHLFVQEI
jgi:hypothetical protein